MHLPAGGNCSRRLCCKLGGIPEKRDATARIAPP
jgi:hypothetical protein